MVKDKARDIAILRTMGASPRSIMLIFMVQGASSGIAGTLGGVLFGVLAVITAFGLTGRLRPGRPGSPSAPLPALSNKAAMGEMAELTREEAG